MQPVLSQYFTLRKSALRIFGHADREMSIEQAMSGQVSKASQVAADNYASNYTCNILQQDIRCLIGRHRPYIYPYECRLTAAKHKTSNLQSIFLPMLDPLSATFKQVPLVYDQSYVAEDVQDNVTISDTSLHYEKVELTCPCFCKVECQVPIRNMLTLQGPTMCGDCKCLHSDIGCLCLDNYDMEFAHLQDKLRTFVEHHSSYNDTTAKPSTKDGANK
ncbi:hypothetical protein HDE_00721 [Halotydeus destructor]|nr:hypothetical protein HDE_00721 [Halotydeus destructor]